MAIRYPPRKIPKKLAEDPETREFFAELLESVYQIWFALEGSDTALLSKQQTGYTEFANLTPDRTLDADSTTVDEVADVLGTLIEDLKTKDLIRP